VGLVDGDERGLALGQHLRETGDPEALGGDEEELQGAIEVIDAGLAADGAVEAGVNAGDGEAEFAELGALIFNESDERADDESCAAAGDGGELVAEGFSGAGGHDEENIFALDGGLADGFLIDAEGGEAEISMEKLGEGLGIRFGSLGDGFWRHSSIL
jgi:hypothetical protein